MRNQDNCDQIADDVSACGDIKDVTFNTEEQVVHLHGFFRIHELWAILDCMMRDDSEEET